ncbi:hypothetical protein [Pedobacter panaciterrae]|jgi:hypothetical protein|uniref:Uncharacterized protein n=1 Tax=Pedobacter panaciterrae TaxID=363849 RepID=A0ABU8NN24_9SPHI|nr:hypothetical protein [Pedobacter panaciterrae]NQX53233.1 hypothetical protein [Pedobacter panaciterrae]
MEEKKPKKDDCEEEGPLSFRVEKVSPQKIKEHWQKIANRINGIPKTAPDAGIPNNKDNPNKNDTY